MPNVARVATMLLYSSSVAETEALGKRLASLCIPDDFIVLSGDLGAGKTQFAKGFASGLGVEEALTSPTFPILVQYQGTSLTLLHLDLYRLEDEMQLEDIDWYGLQNVGAVCLVEWGDRFPSALPDEYLALKVRIENSSERIFEVTGYGARGHELEGGLS